MIHLRTLRGAPLCAIVCGAMILNGCVAIPIPWPASKAHVTEEQAKTLEPTAMDRDAVRAALGGPDLRRDRDRLWIYGSSETEGKWLGGDGRDAKAPILRRRRVLFLTFDDLGILTSSALVQTGWEMLNEEDRNLFGRKRSSFCTDAQLCVEGWHKKLRGDMERLDDADTAVFRKGDLPAHTPVSPDNCRLVAVVDESWVWGFRPFVSFRVDEQWGGFARLSSSAVATIDLEPGKHHFSAPAVPEEFFECPPGRTIAVKLRYEDMFLRRTDSPTRMVSTPLDESELAAALAKPRLILPDKRALSDAAEN